MPRPLGVLLRLDGVVHASDLPVQSYARHLTELLPAHRVRPLIAGMRGFLENKPKLIGADVDLRGAEDGYHAVDILGRAAGLTQEQLSAARVASRLDLAASAWAVEPAVGLDQLLDLLAGHAFVVVLAEPADPAAAAVLESLDVRASIDQLIAAPIKTAIGSLVDRVGAAQRLLVVGARWTGELAVAADAGCATALLDRYGRGTGTPTFRADGGEPADLLDPIRRWLASPAATPTPAPAHSPAPTPIDAPGAPR